MLRHRSIPEMIECAALEHNLCRISMENKNVELQRLRYLRFGQFREIRNHIEFDSFDGARQRDSTNQKYCQ